MTRLPEPENVQSHIRPTHCVGRLLRREIEIDAPPETVWAILVAFDRYSEWNPFIVKASGRAVAGTRLSSSMLVGRHRMTFNPVVTEVRPLHTLEWLGRLGPGGLFDGRHRFTLEPAGPGRTRLIQEERFSGILVPLFGRVLRETEAAFGSMNASLATRAASLPQIG